MQSENRPDDELPDGTPGQAPSTRPDRGDPAATGSADEADPRLAAYAAALAAAAGTGADRPEPLAALRLIGGLRAGLDELERQLVEAAREQRASWSQIATALGLASRQAAEQRWVRLSGAATRDPSGAATRDPARVRVDRKRQRVIDDTYGTEISRLRAAVVATHRRLGAASDRDDWHPLARLADTTLGLAGSADPGALYALATQAANDLEQVPAGQLGAALANALDRLRQALDQATPATEPSDPGDAGR